jgi:hypothetical protein
LEAARLRLLQAREELEYRLVEAAVAKSLTAADDASTSENNAVAGGTAAGSGGGGGGKKATEKEEAPDRDALVELLRRGDDLDERNVHTVVDRLRAIEAAERVAEWRKLKAVESRRRVRATRAAEAARLASVDTKYARKEEKNVMKYEEWVQRKPQPGRAPKPDETRRRLVEEALLKEAELREKNRQAVAQWKAAKAADESERRRREAAARRKLDSEMAMRRLESEMWMKNHRFHEPCELYVAPPQSVFTSTFYD